MMHLSFSKIKILGLVVLTACGVNMGAVPVYAVDNNVVIDNTIATVGNVTKATTRTLSDGAVVTINEYDNIVSAAPPADDREMVMLPDGAMVPKIKSSSDSVAANPVPVPNNAALITVDLVIFSGQSNMSGVGGKPSKAPSVPEGHGYEFRSGKYPAGLYNVEEPFGTSASGYLCDPDGVRSGSLVSAFMNTYYNKTGVPVLGISASRGGTSVSYWDSQEVKSDLIDKYQAAKSWCSANNVKIRRQYIVWLQGETDAIANMSVSDYQSKMKSIFSPAFVRGIEQVFIITIGNFAGLPGAYDNIVAAQIDLCAKDSHFTLATDILHKLPESYLSDGVHYNQDALNQAGAAAAQVMAYYR